MAADPGFNPSSMVLPHDVKAMAFTCIGLLRRKSRLYDRFLNLAIEIFL